MPDTQTCQPDRLEAFVEGKLSVHDEVQLAVHLEECSVCRRRLDEIAAAPNTWARATAFLKDDPFDLALISGSSDAQSTLQPQIKQVLDVLNPTDDPEMIGRLGSYEVSGVIGSGGMGIVLKAFDRPLDRTVAIKVMAPHLATSGAARQRFSREARAAAAVIHPNVIAIYGVATDTTLPYLVMPYVGGASLQKRLDTEGALQIADILRIGIQIASGLSAAHKQGLVHRDIKPANILLDQGVDRLVITDFGLARTVDDASVTRTGVIAGTPQYMSPEQARGEPVDARSDLFSFGSVLYAACTGRVPFRAESPYGVLRRITDNSPRPIREINPQIPDWLCRIIDRLHAKSAEDRFQSAEEVSQLLTQCLAHLTQPTVHSLPKEVKSAYKFYKAMPISVLRVAVSSVLLLATCYFGYYLIAKWSNDSVAVSHGDSNSVAWMDTETESKPVPSSPITSESDSESAQNYDVAVPSKSADAVTNWNDGLSPVVQHIEKSFRNLQNPSWPPALTQNRDLAIIADRSKTAKLGGLVVYSVAVGNYSNNDAEDVRLTISLPEGLEFVSDGVYPTPMLQSKNVCVWEQGTLSSLRQLDVSVDVKAAAIGIFDVKVQVDSRGRPPVYNTIRTDVQKNTVQ